MTTAIDRHAALLVRIDDYLESASDDQYPVTEPLAALRAAVKLHAPMREPDWPECCAECTRLIGRGAAWGLDDCATIRTIAEQLGI
jgi:hypothetical protein